MTDSASTDGNDTWITYTNSYGTQIKAQLTKVEDDWKVVGQMLAVGDTY